jgi:hypothetical protein
MGLFVCRLCVPNLYFFRLFPSAVRFSLHHVVRHLAFFLHAFHFTSTFFPNDIAFPSRSRPYLPVRVGAAQPQLLVIYIKIHGEGCDKVG